MARLTFAFIAGLLSIAHAGLAGAAEIKVLTTGAMRAVVIELLPEFESKTGHKVVVDNATAGMLAKRIVNGEAFDVAMITPVIVDDLMRRGKIAPGSRLDLAVRSGPPPTPRHSPSAWTGWFWSPTATKAPARRRSRLGPDGSSNCVPAIAASATPL